MLFDGLWHIMSAFINDENSYLHLPVLITTHIPNIDLILRWNMIHFLYVGNQMTTSRGSFEKEQCYKNELDLVSSDTTIRWIICKWV